MKILYVDMDNTLVNFTARLDGVDPMVREQYRGREDELPAAYKRLILSHHKNLNVGDHLVDDRPLHNGADRFTGELVAFGSTDFPDWPAVTAYLRDRA